VLAARGGEARARELTLHTALAPAASAGSPRLAERLVANLVDNALRHNEPGGRVEVGTRTADGRAVLSVANTGPEVPAAAVVRLFEPFQRLGADRTSHRQGQGLGLSIVRAVADTHGASVATWPRPGGGLLIEVAFPPA
jgi:signal transduction histidine kinase